MWLRSSCCVYVVTLLDLNSNNPFTGESFEYESNAFGHEQSRALARCGSWTYMHKGAHTLQTHAKAGNQGRSYVTLRFLHLHSYVAPAAGFCQGFVRAGVMKKKAYSETISSSVYRVVINM